MTMFLKHRRLRRIFILFAAIGLFAALGTLGVRNLAHWLVVSDPLEPAHAIVVLNGEIPHRAAEAARIYHQGFAPEVWVTADRRRVAVDALGIHFIGDDEYNAEVLKKFGVPQEAIHCLAQPVRNTEEEEMEIIGEAKRVGADRIIVVTSSYHTRRTRAIWHALTGNSPKAIVRGETEEPFDASHWWRNSDDATKVIHELGGLFNAWVRFPARPIRD
jgi:uncharacterized SAM-binding protein YcdF (DUF218 family)